MQVLRRPLYVRFVGCIVASARSREGCVSVIFLPQLDFAGGI